MAIDAPVSLHPRAPSRIAQVTTLAPGRPALMLGARTAIATMWPLLLSHWLGPDITRWATLGGFTTALADKGGSYRLRASTMGAVAVFGALAVMLGSAVGPHAILATVAMFAWIALCSFAGVLGPPAASPGTTVAVLFALSIAMPDSHASHAGIGVITGGAAAIVLALLFWPVRVYKPARYAVARSYRALAQHVTEMISRVAQVGSAEWIAQLPLGHAAIRQQIEGAREILVATRRGRRGESGRGARLLALMQSLDLLFAAHVQLEDLIESAAEAGMPSALRDEIAQALSRHAAALAEIAARTEPEGALPPPPALAPLAAALTAAVREARNLDAALHLDLAHIVAVFERVDEQLHNAYETTATLHDDSPVASEPARIVDNDATPNLLQLVRDNLTPHSVFFRHALRVAVVATIAVAITRVLHLHRGYWVTLTVINLLQPYTSATVTKALQRIAGTVLGGVVAALLILWLHQHTALLIVVTLLAAVSAAVLQLNYALFAFFLTPTFVLLAEANTRETHLAELRIVNTLVGSVLAFGGAYFLWPHAERRHFAEELATAIHALRDYFVVAARIISERAPRPQPQLHAARRAFGLAINRADISFQRMLADGDDTPDNYEAMMTLLLYARRLGATIGSAASARHLARTPTVELDGFRAEVTRALTEIAEVIRTGGSIGATPALAPIIATVTEPAVAARLRRSSDQLRIMHQALARWRRQPPN